MVARGLIEGTKKSQGYSRVLEGTHGVLQHRPARAAACAGSTPAPQPHPSIRPSTGAGRECACVRVRVHAYAYAHRCIRMRAHGEAAQPTHTQTYRSIDRPVALLQVRPPDATDPATAGLIPKRSVGATAGLILKRSVGATAGLIQRLVLSNGWSYPDIPPFGYRRVRHARPRFVIDSFVGIAQSPFVVQLAPRESPGEASPAAPLRLPLVLVSTREYSSALL
jgi:hypothetical protein